MAGHRNNMTPLGKEIKKKLIDKNMSQVELAATVGTTKGYITKIITGYRSGEKYLEHICRILEIDLKKYRRVA